MLKLVPVVLDSSVLAPAQGLATIRHRILAHCIESSGLFLSEYIIAETARVIRDDFGLPETVPDFIALLRQNATIVEPVALPTGVCRDATDLPVIGTAVAAQAAYLVSSDADILTLQSYHGIRIIKPGAYYRLLTGL